MPKFPGFAGMIFLVFLSASTAPLGAVAQTSTPAGPTQAPAVAPPASEQKAVPAEPMSPPTPSAKETTEPNKSTGSSLIPHDLSPSGMFMNADIVVKIVMVGLAIASFVTWTLLIAKTIELFGAQRRAAADLATLAASDTLRSAASQLDQPKAPVARMAEAALTEIARSRGLHSEGVKERATALLGRIEARAGRSMGRGTGVLATIGSTAPFVGLFGTVWGIMNSFIGISKTNTTNLAVVAPGIAEALLATAFGLVAAIPAVIIYNLFARGITGYRSVLGDASTEVLRLLSRDLDRDAEASVQATVRRQAAE